MSLLFYIPVDFASHEILSIFQAFLWLMPVPRKSSSYRSGGKSSRLTDRNGHALSSRQVTKTISPLVRQSSPSIPLLTLSPIYHKPCVITPTLSSTQFESLYFGFHVSMLVLHCVNIYQSNLHLVDVYLLLFVVMVTVQRSLWLVTKQTLASEVIHSTVYWVMVASKATTILLLLLLTLTAMYLTISNSTLEDILFLCYPLGIYIWAFGLTLNPNSQKILLRMNTHVTIHKASSQYQTEDVNGRPCDSCVNGQSPVNPLANNKTHKEVLSKSHHYNSRDGSTQMERYRNNNSSRNHEITTTATTTQDQNKDNILKLEYCSIPPESIRCEAESLRVDFNLRLTKVVFNSLLSAYYIGFVPLKFTQNGWLHYDVWWSLQFTLYIWVTSFVLLFGQFLPNQYIDGLHRCASHLGQWVIYMGKHQASDIWTGVTAWPNATLVRHQHNTYKSIARQNAATPGDLHHYRFYYLFHSPLRLHNILVLIQLTSSLLQLMSVIQSSNSQQLIAMATILSFNYVLLFRLLRDRWATAETVDEHESCTNSNAL